MAEPTLSYAPVPAYMVATTEGGLMYSIYQILQLLLSVLWWIIIIQIVLSWLFAFNVINHSNDFVRQLVRGLDSITEPLYRPIRRILPDFGGLDFAPMVVLLVVIILQRILLPNIFASLIANGAA